MKEATDIRRVKVCQLCAVDFTLKNFLLPLIDAMRDRGWDVQAVCSDGPFTKDLRLQGYFIKTISVSRSMNPFVAVVTLFRLMRFFRQEQFDVLHVHTPVAALLGRLAAWLTRIPVVVYTAHGFYFHEDMPYFKYRFFVALERIAGWWTDLLFTQSFEDARSAVTEKIMSENQVTVIGNGVQVTRFDPSQISSRSTIRASMDIPVDAYVVGFIGRQVREKGVVEFLEVAKALGPLYPNLYFLLIGERLSSDHASGVYEEHLQAKSILGAALIAPGSRDDIPEMISAMDLFCLPSWREGMPRTIIEAMMMGKPVVATDIRGSREEVIHEETGLLVPPRSPKLLAEAIERLLNDREWGVQLGRAGRARALALYDESQVIKLQLERIEMELRHYEARI